MIFDPSLHKFSLNIKKHAGDLSPDDTEGPPSPPLSKKASATRWKELLEVVSPALLEYLRDNAATMAMDKATSVTISDILASTCGDLRPAMTAVAQLANQELVPGGIKGQVCETEVRNSESARKDELIDLFSWIICDFDLLLVSL